MLLLGLSLVAHAVPVITSVNPALGPTDGGIIITISGTGLDDNDPVLGDKEPTVRLNNQLMTIVGDPTPTSIKFGLPAGQGSNLEVRVIFDSQSDTSSFSYQPPMVSVVGGSSPTQGGGALTISGSNFGLNGSVTIGGQSAVVTSWNHSSINATAPAGEGLDLPVVVTTGGQSSPPFLGFSYGAPVITMVSAASRPTAGNIAVTLNGSNFGTTAALEFGGNPVTVDGQTHNSLTFTLPEGQGTNIPMVVSVAGQLSLPANFDYDAPVIVSMNPVTGPAPVETEITLQGNNFGTSPSVQFGAGVGSIISASHSEIVFTRPAGEVGNLAVVVEAAGQLSMPADFLSTELSSLPGYYIDTTLGVIVAAPAGTYAPDPDMSEPLPCPVGTYTPIAGMSAPLPASPGYYVSSIGASTQTAAPPGKFTDAPGMPVPTIAPSGTYVPVAGMQQAIPAAPGYYVPSMGANEQNPAPPGSFTNAAGQSEPTPASPGTYSPVEGMSSAIPASPGYYVSSIGASTQEPAPPGRFTHIPGQVSSISAPPGSYIPIAGMQAAIPASPGYFVPLAGSIAQVPAALGKYVSTSQALEDTIAEVGTYAPIQGMRASIPAPEGTYAPFPGSSTVLQIPAGFESADGVTLAPLPEVQVVTAEVLPGGDFQIAFTTNSTDTYGVFYTENLSDYVMVQTEAGTGGEVQVTVDAPNPSATRRFWVIAPIQLPE